jgi:hypothetical protein
MQHSPLQLRRNAHYNRQHQPNSTTTGDTYDPHQAQECVLARGGYRVRLADSPGQRSKASMLIKSMYSWRGYPTDEIIIPTQDPNRITLEASTGQELFGTLTVGLDTNDGLLADELYQEEIDALRRMGHRVCEMTKLAFDPKYSSKEVIASLFHLAYIYAHNFYHATDLLIEVNPRHAGFYKRRLGFQQIGELRTCPRVDAPAVLLHISLDYMATQISAHAGAREKCEKSLYPYFFSEAEVLGLTTRIRSSAQNPLGATHNDG